jgi:adenylate cyclase
MGDLNEEPQPERIVSSEESMREWKRLERREWQLWSLAILTILWLTFGLVLTPLPQWVLGERLFNLKADLGSGLYYLGLVVLVFCLCLYLISSHREVRLLRSRLLITDREIQEMVWDLEGLRSLFKVTASISAQMELPSLLRMIAKEAVLAVGANQSSLMLLDKSRTILRTVAAYGADTPEIQNARARLGEGVVGWVAQHGKPRILQGRVNPDEFPHYVPKERTITSAACVPLQIKDRTIGVLNVNLLGTDRQFADNDLRLLMIYGNQAAVAIRNAALFRETQEKAKMRAILEGYVSPPVAEALMRNPKGWMNLGETRELTVMFADIRGFTRVVDNMGPQRTRLFLNQFFTLMSEIIFKNQGTLDKFIGDSVMAFFGAPIGVTAPAVKAIEAARSMVQGFEDIRSEWATASPDVAELSLGIGISTGHLFIGNVGSKKRFDYTVIGQEVNVAKRLCDMAQGGQILISETTRKRLSGDVPVRHLGDVRFKGLERSVHLFECVRT